MKTFKTIIFILSVILYIISFRTLKTRILRQRDAQIIKERWEGKRQKEIQKLLDAEHARGYGKMVVDGRMKEYEPYTSMSIRK
ncbi:MAG: hypothetical protein IJ504_01010 [Bacteroidales bacterium]|nr:hypothetical protein [Bacteroidales bacterium]